MIVPHTTPLQQSLFHLLVVANQVVCQMCGLLVLILLLCSNVILLVSSLVQVIAVASRAAVLSLACWLVLHGVELPIQFGGAR